MSAKLDKRTFITGMNSINSILSNSCQLKENATIETYFYILKDISNYDYEKGVLKLLKEWEYSNRTPSPANIRSYVEKVSTKVMSYEDKQLLKRINSIIVVKKGVKNND